MTRYEYTAQLDTGAELTGTIEASASDEAAQQLRSMGLANINLSPAPPRTRQRPIKSDDLVFFNEQMASLAKAGVPLDSGIRQLAKDIESPALGRVLEQVADEIAAGVPLDQALEKHGDRLPALYGRVVRAGIETGRLPATLLNLSSHLRLVSQTRRDILQALTYPAVVLGAACLMFLGLLWFLVPQFEAIYVDFGVELPLLTVVMIDLSRSLGLVLLIAGGLAVGLTIVALVFRKSKFWQDTRESLILSIPLLGGLIRNSIRARFFRAMSFAVSSGIPLPEGVRLCAASTGSTAACVDAENIAKAVEQGGAVFDACMNTLIVPPMFGYVLQISADREQVEEALVELSTAYESRARQGQALIRTWLPPLAVVFVGMTIGLVILALLLPLNTLYSSMWMGF